MNYPIPIRGMYDRMSYTSKGKQIKKKKDSELNKRVKSYKIRK